MGTENFSNQLILLPLRDEILTDIFGEELLENLKKMKDSSLHLLLFYYYSIYIFLFNFLLKLESLSAYVVTLSV